MKINLYPHQKKVLTETKDYKRVAYFLDMGLGKTFVGSEKLYSFGNDTNLVICQKSKINDWIEHFTTYYPQAVVFDLTQKGKIDEFVYRHNAWHNTRGAGFYVGVINYELAWRRPDLLQLEDFALMLDESSLIQNHTAKQTKFILKFKPREVILLSGTPTSGRYERLWTQCNLLGWNISHKLYQQQYINWTTMSVGWGLNARSIKIVDKKNPYKNVERLKRKLREYGAVFMKTEECFELPEQIFTTVRCDRSKYYDKFLKTDIVTVDGEELIGDTSLTKHLYLRQLCGAFSKEKLSAFDDLVKSTDERLIVFYNFNNELDQLMKIALDNERPLSIVNGRVKDLDAYNNCDNSITLIQYQAGAMGLNLQLANKIIYYSLPERSDLFEQSKKRIHRIGQDRTCFYYVMLCKNSIENAIYNTLKERKDWTDELFKEYINGIF